MNVLTVLDEFCVLAGGVAAAFSGSLAKVSCFGLASFVTGLIWAARVSAVGGELVEGVLVAADIAVFRTGLVWGGDARF